MVGAARGYRVKLCLPDNASPERKMILRALGAELVLTDPLEGTDGAIREARRLNAAEPDRYFYPDQYNNDGNWRAHYDTTGPEIIEQTSGRLTHFVAGLGTSGTFVGTGRRLRKFNPAIRLISFQPSGPFHGLEGLKHMDSAMVPGIYDPSVADEDLRVRASAPTRWCGALRARKDCSPAFRQARPWRRRCRSPAARAWRGGDHFPGRCGEVSHREILGCRCLTRLLLESGLRRRFGDTVRRHIRTSAAVRWSGAKDRAAAVVALPNTTEEGPRRRFLVRPSDYRLAEQRAVELGAELLGFYHSHPDHPARPSQYDLDHAWPTFVYVIVAVAAGAAADMTVWWLKEDRTTFEKGDLHGDENSDSHTTSAVHG